MFGTWAPELIIFDLKIGFRINNSIFSPQIMYRISKVGPKMVRSIFEYAF